MIVIGIAHDARDLGGLGELDHLEVGGEHLVVGLADEGEALGGGGPSEDLGELFEQDALLSQAYPSSVPSQVIAQSGDTLRTVAQRVFGDATLWYLIAEENGLSDPDAQLTEGSSLRIPNEVVLLSNTASSFKPFDVSDAIGDTTPTQAMPPVSKKKGCGIIGQIIVAIVVIVVAYYTGIYLGEILGPSIFGTTVVKGMKSNEMYFEARAFLAEQHFADSVGMPRLGTLGRLEQELGSRPRALEYIKGRYGY